MFTTVPILHNSTACYTKVATMKIIFLGKCCFSFYDLFRCICRNFTFSSMPTKPSFPPTAQKVVIMLSGRVLTKPATYNDQQF